jgi:cation transport regulator ChaB
LQKIYREGQNSARKKERDMDTKKTETGNLDEAVKILADGIIRMRKKKIRDKQNNNQQSLTK